MTHEAAKKLAQQDGAEVRRYLSGLAGRGAWSVTSSPAWIRSATYTAITPERTIVSGGKGISDADLITAAGALGGAQCMDVINHRGIPIKSYGSLPIDSPAPDHGEVQALRMDSIQAVADAIGRGMSDRHLYADLARILTDALLQASQGKGAERHANGLPFDKQPMQTISDTLGSPDFMAGQVMKKVNEARGLPTLAARRAELLGAINYCAGMILWYERQEGSGDD